MKKVKILIFLVTMALVAGGLYGAIFGNEGCRFYQSGCDNGGGRLAKGSPTIAYYIAEGAGYFFSAHSHYLQLMQTVELSEIGAADPAAQQNALNLAVENLENAVSTYDQLIALATDTPYNPIAIEKLTTFNYGVFKKKFNLNAPVFDAVTDVLADGDITGVYAKLRAQMITLTNQLKSIQARTLSGQTPAVSTYWQTNNHFALTLLYGQYAAMIFSTI